MGFIDCDSHVIETEATWEYFDPSEVEHKPRVIEFQDPERSFMAGVDVAPDVRPQRLWVFGDTWTRQFPSDGDVNGKGNVFGESTLDLGRSNLEGGSVKARLQDLDALGIDFQVMHSSFWISGEVEQALPEAALARSYNRWVADITSDHTDRLGWTLRAPTRHLERAFEEMEFGKEHGAVGVHLKGIEHGMFLSNPYFYPIYERAQDLDLTMVVHVGNSARRAEQLTIGRVVPVPEALMDHLGYLITGFWSVVAANFHERFPRLRWAFLEGGCTWAPAVLQQHARLRVSVDHKHPVTPVTSDELAAKNIFISCELDEDLPYLIKRLGDGILVAGTDYGHNDVGADLGAHETIMSRKDIEFEQARKIVDGNGRRLFGIDEDFCPAPQLQEPIELPHVRGARTEDGRPLMSVAG